MTDEKPQRISIGFVGGQALAARVKVEELAKLRQALGATGWHDLKAEAGAVAIDLDKIVFIQVDDEEHRVGFGT
ncbi:MAG TPA: hypothetical protein VG294_04115 [Solirubrobacteraceae bacterium]|jgi:hypothetical protein|nr:hypothetical protein [Solirubrobacteraceae bacterium]